MQGKVISWLICSFSDGISSSTLLYALEEDPNVSNVIREVKTLVKSLKEEVDYLKALKGNQNAACLDHRHRSEIETMLPVDSLEEFQEFDQTLGKKESKKAFVSISSSTELLNLSFALQTMY